MKKVALAVIISLFFLIFLLPAIQVIEMAKANFFPPADNRIAIRTPLNTTYTCNSLDLSFEAKYLGPGTPSDYVDLWIKIDGTQIIQVTNRTTQYGTIQYLGNGYPNDIIRGNATLPNLPYGEHNLTIAMGDYAFNHTLCSASAFFSIATPIPIISPTQQPASEPNQTAQSTTQPEKYVSPMPYLILAGILIALVIVGLAVYFTKFRKKKT